MLQQANKIMKQKNKENKINKATYMSALIDNKQLFDTFNTIQNNLIELKDIKEHDKFYFEKKKLLLDKYSYSQPIFRYWYSINRINTFFQLQESLQQFNNCTKQMEYLLNNKYPYNSKIDVVSLASKMNIFNNIIENALSNLEITYKNDTNIINIINKLKKNLNVLQIF